MREQVLQYVDQYKIIAIVRGADPKQCFAVAEALYAGGIRLMEVTYDQKKPETWQATADTIGALAKEYEGRMFVGAGTVTSPELVFSRRTMRRPSVHWSPCPDSAARSAGCSGRP